MAEYRSLSHTKWDCKYHVVFIPKRRKKVIYGQIRRMLGDIFHELASHKEVEIVEGHLRPDHVHMCLRVPPKYAVSNIVGYLKGKSTIMIARFLWERREISWVRTFGLGATLYPQLDSMKRRSLSTSGTRKPKRSVTNS